MRRLLAFLASLLLIWGCEELFPTEKPMISLDSDQAKSVTVSEDGGSFDVAFTSALSWTAEIVYSDGADGWASLNKTSGEGGYNIAKIKVAVQKNESGEERSAKLVIKSDTVSEEITFTQPAAEVNPGPGPGPEPEPAVFELTEGSAEIGAEGGKIQVTVQFNVEYECTVTVDWIREVETKAYDEKVHTFEIDANTATESRSATISFCGNGTCIPFTVTQAANEEEPEPEPEPVFELSKNSAEVVADGGTVDVTVTANVDYEYTVTVDWITEKEIVAVSDTEKKYVFEVAANTATESRSVTISFCGNGTCIPFTVTQAAAEPEYYINVDRMNVSVQAEGTSSPVTVNVTSNVAWTVAIDAAWCTVSPASGENNGSFAVTVSENTSYDSRMANIIVASPDGTVSKNIAVIQSPAQQEGGDDAWKTAGFYHRSLAFRFTADWCGYCPMMATAMSNAQKQLSGKLEVISVHGSGSGLACDASNTLANSYSISSFPTGLVDGRTFVENYDIATTTTKIVDAVNDTEAKYDTYTGTSWTSSVSGSQVTLDLAAYIKKAGSYKVTALLVEDKVTGYQADYNNGTSDNYEHTGIIRAALSDALGESFEISADGQIKNFTYTATLPSECNVSNVRVVVYIQRLDASKNSYYVDNSASAKVGKSQALEVTSGNWSDGNEGIVPGDDINL